MKQSDLVDLTAKWQARLRLRDWNIKLKLVSSMDLDLSVLAEISWQSQFKRATIYLLNPKYIDREDVKKVVEDAIVHELLHLHFIPFRPEDEKGKDDMEVAINMIADALLNGVEPKRPRKKGKEVKK